MQLTATVTAIGKDALSSKDPMIILFGPQATDALRDVAVIQQFADKSALEKLVIKEGDQLTIDDETFEMTYVGQLANSNLKAIGHVTLLFQAVPADNPMQNAIYLKPTHRPTFKVGTTLTYITQAN